MSRLLEQLGAWKPFTALVVGDFMLDQLVYGNADRLSPEAPVPVLHVQRTEDRPGGAANVCLDLVAMRARVHAYGVVGDDREADLLRSGLAAAGVQADGLVGDGTRPTTVKRSLIGLAQHRHPQKMFRVDYESRVPLARAAIEQILARFEADLRDADVVCIEDYNKGVCTPELCARVIEVSRRAGVPVLVDPAAIEDYSRYAGASTITPNRTESMLACGTDLPDGAGPEAFGPLAARLVESLGLEAVVVTLDRHGALLLERGGAPLHIPTAAREVYDVTGAGDMVLAALAGARANRLDWPDAVRLANAAAGLEVEVFGVVPIPIEKIHREVLLRERSMPGKMRTLEQLLVEVAALRNESRRVVFTNGCFDILHAGHLSLLERAAALGDYLIVGLNSDDSVRRLKGGKDPSRPINNEHDRALVLGGLGCVGAVTIFGDDTPERLIRAIRPDVLVKGAEYTMEQVPGARFVIENGGRVELLPMVDGRSTTGAVARIRGGSA
ncbi:MAG: bifunctional heptose 7-phosphate kinase/heptose 1-phosphate adenyltransferase [Phycisphaeraceae bacterium]|nr:bifunctional heptose 7-phosphate kinase/heptose 1-phosphate adenyltransferase [Phycisphaeraceae bacterium]